MSFEIQNLQKTKDYNFNRLGVSNKYHDGTDTQTYIADYILENSAIWLCDSVTHHLPCDTWLAPIRAGLMVYK